MLQCCNVAMLQCCKVAKLQSGKLAMLQCCNVPANHHPPPQRCQGVKGTKVPKVQRCKGARCKVQRCKGAKMQRCKGAKVQSCQQLPTVANSCQQLQTDANSCQKLQKVAKTQLGYVCTDGRTCGRTDRWASWAAVAAKKEKRKQCRLLWPLTSLPVHHLNANWLECWLLVSKGLCWTWMLRWCTKWKVFL